MQAQYFKLTKQFHQSISIRQDVRPYFYNEWHYHSELELVYVVKGEGTRFIGNNISQFSAGDLVLLGANLPHVWKSENHYSKPESKKKVSVIILHFPHNFCGDLFWELPEVAPVKKLLEQSHLGISYPLPSQHTVKKQLKKMLELSPFNRLLALLSLLNDLSVIEEKEVLSSIPFADHYQKHQSKRIDRIYNYILNNFEKKIELEDVASLANMTSSSLCRFFKQKTHKSLCEFINEVRIGYACKLMISGELTVSDICFRCGYNNLSYFNRQFKKITSESPSQYIKRKNQFK